MNDKDTAKKRYQLMLESEVSGGKLAYGLRIFGDYIAEREGYKEHREINAVHFYLVNKYGWLPSVVRSMNYDDLRFLLEEEMSGWVYPPEAR